VRACQESNQDPRHENLNEGDQRALFVITKPIEFADRLKNFRSERINTMLEGIIPVTMEQEARIVLHIIPKRALEEEIELDLGILLREGQSLRPIHAHGWDALRYNFDGLLTVSSADGIARSYVQIFHNGCIEAVNTSLLRPRKDRLSIPSLTFEDELRKFLAASLPFLQKLAVEPPLYIMLSLLRVKSYYMGSDRGYYDDIVPFDRDTLLVRETVMDSFDDDIDHLMRPVFNRVWNGSGVPASPYFDEQGRWQGKSNQ
jgi:hypothetical protein